MKEIPEISVQELRAEAEGSVREARYHYGDRPCPEKALTVLKRYFEDLRPGVPGELAIYLAQQQARKPGNRLFTDPEMDLAVWAHARAYGWWSNGTHPSSAVATQDYSEELPEALLPHLEFISPLIPPPLNWGAISHLQDKVLAGLESPIIHAWMYQDASNEVTEAVLIGQGIPEVRAEVTAAVLSCFFAVEPKFDDFVLSGAMRLAAVEMEKLNSEGARSSRGFNNPDIRIGTSMASEITIPQSAKEAMTLLQGALRRLQDATGFVQVHMVPHSDQRSFLHTILQYTDRASRSDEVYIWSASESGDGRVPDIVTMLPFEQLRSSSSEVLGLDLNYDLLLEDSYRDLSDKYYNTLVNDILEDVRRRVDFYARQRQLHEQQRDWFGNLSAEEQGEVPDVWAEYLIDFAAGVLFRAAAPQRYVASVYYTEVMEQFIIQDTQWMDITKTLQQRIERMLQSETASLERIIAARLLDAALRNVEPFDDPVLLTEFRAWKSRVQPMLLLEWRRLFADRNIAPQDVCTRHTVFNLMLEKEYGQFALMPYSVVDVRRSVVLLDSERGVQVVLDATDEATQSTFEPDPSSAGILYEEARQLAEQNVATEHVRERLWASMIKDPKGITQRVLGEWLDILPEPDTADFDDLSHGATRKALPVLAASSAIRWINEFCAHSADEVLTEAESMVRQISPYPHAAVLLIRAYLECWRRGQDAIGSLRGIMRGQISPEAEVVAQYLHQAYQLNPKLVEHFLENNQFAPANFPQNDFPSLSTEETGAIDVQIATEAANLASRITDALASLDSTYESRRSAYAKLVPVIEECYGLRFSSLPDLGGLDRLLTLLTGEERRHI